MTITSDKIYRAFYADYGKEKTFYHGHTYTANPISCAAALANLEIFEEEKTLDRLKRLIPVFHKGLERFNNVPIVGDVRYIGMIGAFELVRDKETKTPFASKERIGLRIYKDGLKRHLVLRPLGNIIYLFLPLCIKERELEYILDNTYQAIQSYRSAP